MTVGHYTLHITQMYGQYTYANDTEHVPDEDDET